MSSLDDALREVDRLVAGDPVVLEFASDQLRDDFKRLAEPMRVVFA